MARKPKPKTDPNPDPVPVQPTLDAQSPSTSASGHKLFLRPCVLHHQAGSNAIFLPSSLACRLAPGDRIDLYELDPNAPVYTRVIVREVHSNIGLSVALARFGPIFHDRAVSNSLENPAMDFLDIHSHLKLRLSDNHRIPLSDCDSITVLIVTAP
jgi:hypothetical protein